MKRFFLSLLWVILTGVVTLQSTQAYNNLEVGNFSCSITEESSGSDEDSDERKEIDKSLNKIFSSFGAGSFNISHFTKYDQKSGLVDFEVIPPPPRA